MMHPVLNELLWIDLGAISIKVSELYLLQKKLLFINNTGLFTLTNTIKNRYYSHNNSYVILTSYLPS